MSIGSRIKEKREELGITQTELAKIVGVSKGSIGNYESGVSAPNEKILFKLFKALKCDANFLYQDDMKAFSKENEFSVSLNEKAMIKKYRKLNAHGKEIVKAVIEIEYKYCEKEEKDTAPAIRAAQSFGDKSKIDRNADIDEQRFIDAPESDIDM